MKLRIKNLRLRTIIGFNDWERKEKQDVVINLELNYDAAAAAKSDQVNDAVDYKQIKKRIIALVEASNFGLLEALAKRIVGLVMEDQRVSFAKVEIDKPQALRFADSVSVEHEENR